MYGPWRTCLTKKRKKKKKGGGGQRKRERENERTKEEMSTAFFHALSQTTSVQIRLCEFDTIWIADLVQKPPITPFPSFFLFYRNNQLSKQNPWKRICANRYSYAKQNFINVSKISIGIRDCSLKSGISILSSKNWNILKANVFFIHLFSLVTSCYWTPHLIDTQTLPVKKSEKIYLIWKWICSEWENPYIQFTWHQN